MGHKWGKKGLIKPVLPHFTEQGLSIDAEPPGSVALVPAIGFKLL